MYTGRLRLLGRAEPLGGRPHHTPLGQCVRECHPSSGGAWRRVTVVHSDSRRQSQRSASGKLAPPWFVSWPPSPRTRRRSYPRSARPAAFFHGAHKYCHNGGMAFAHHHGAAGSGSKNGDLGLPAVPRKPRLQGKRSGVRKFAFGAAIRLPRPSYRCPGKNRICARG
jgi:hypothetical protein